MKRRQSLKYLSIGIGSFITLPSWANGWQAKDVQHGLKLPLETQNTLAELVEAFIPQTDTPGAKELGVHQFIQKIVADCLDKNSRDAFQKGIGQLDELTKNNYSKSFAECTPTQRIEVLQQLENDKNHELSKFYDLAKNLTIQGYLSSELIMVKYYDYKMIPGKFQPCVPVNG
ncbi:MAG: gluconate 2-dehydrogenase subunit 3 family protein [Thermoflexibacter sp.]|jgi:hypothetical protein|nr:gluconate 2-dehydrogenase subunit 3 family protein [Thermoflexibacter sp.]